MTKVHKFKSTTLSTQLHLLQMYIKQIPKKQPTQIIPRLLLALSGVQSHHRACHEVYGQSPLHNYRLSGLTNSCIITWNTPGDGRSSRNHQPNYPQDVQHIVPSVVPYITTIQLHPISEHIIILWYKCIESTQPILVVPRPVVCEGPFLLIIWCW